MSNTDAGLPGEAPDAKPWWSSKVIIGTAVTMVCAVLQIILGKQIDPGLQNQIVDAALLLGQLGGGVVAIVGRFTAKKALT
jgi:putative Ca2+/H+ antiporter (TMEM165/GDT1 family)